MLGRGADTMKEDALPVVFGRVGFGELDICSSVPVEPGESGFAAGNSSGAGGNVAHP
jgi:hypothetical protein